MERAIGDADVVVNALNLPYHTWDRGRLEAQMARVVAAMGQGGKTMLFPGNIYNYAADLRQVTPDQPQNPATPRGAIRKRVEDGFRAAVERGGVQIVILRAGDFYGPTSTEDWFDQAIYREIAKGKVSLLGKPGTGHSWAYLPDMGRAFEALASVRSSLAPFETFHFAGHYVTPERMRAAIAAAAPVPLRYSAFPWVALRIMGLFNPLLREVARMGYLWTHPMELGDERLDQLLGAGFGTGFDAAVAAASARHFERLPARMRESMQPKVA
jgi:nucleoside-diphosphate-sugar epimerase